LGVEGEEEGGWVRERLSLWAWESGALALLLLLAVALR